jgi:3-deoxy-D-manno-octulosonate 8-phosphate phosphatase (KDO 8-P phosphatase)
MRSHFFKLWFDHGIHQAELMADVKTETFMMTLGNRFLIPFIPELIAFDFDGVLTDNKVYVDENGKESVVCNRSDGLAVAFLRKKFPLVILSTETNLVVGQRAKKLGVEVYQGVGDKREMLLNLCEEKRLNIDKVIFIGNDINDLGAIEVCGFSMAPADAHPRVIKEVDHVFDTKGGNGVMREFCELFLEM